MAVFLKKFWWFLKHQNKSVVVLNETFGGSIGLNNVRRASMKASFYFWFFWTLELIKNIWAWVFCLPFLRTCFFFKTGDQIHDKHNQRNPKTCNFIWTALANSMGHKAFCLNYKEKPTDYNEEPNENIAPAEQI